MIRFNTHKMIRFNALHDLSYLILGSVPLFLPRGRQVETPMSRTLLLAALVAAAAAAREPRSAVLPASHLRGGQLSQLASAEPPAAPLNASPPPASLELSGGAALQAYLEAMGSFMERFSQLVDTATGSCKPNFFGMPSPSAAKIRSRPDRQALQQAHRHLHNLHTDALAMASAATLPAFAAASMRLHQQLLLLLEDTEPPLGSPTALVTQEDATALRALRTTCTQKPQGTVTAVLQQARDALPESAAASQRLVAAALAAGGGGGGGGGGVGGGGGGFGGGGGSAALAAQARQLEAEMGATLEATLLQAGAASAAQLESQARRCEAAEKEAAGLATRLRELEAAAAAGEGEGAAAAAVASSQAELASSRQEVQALQATLQTSQAQEQAASGASVQAQQLLEQARP